MPAHTRFRSIGLSLIFSGFIFFPFFNDRSGLVKDIESHENRAMAKEPDFNINLLDPFPPLYEQYYNDHFTIRNRVLKSYNNFNLRVYQKSPWPERIAIGYDGWLFLMGHEMNTYLGRNRFTEDQLETWKENLELHQRYLKERGCEFYFIITPSKANIHSEYVPGTFYRINEQPWGEQLIEYLRKNSNVNVISLFDLFNGLKEDHQLYYKLDNHWNKQGAFYAAQATCERIHRDLPSVWVPQLNDYELKKSEMTGGDIVNWLNNPETFTDVMYEYISRKTNKPPVKEDSVYTIRTYDPEVIVSLRENNDPKKPKLMIVSDSFTNDYFPFIAESFDKSVNVFDRWNYKLYPDLVEQEKPDVYIMMIFEPWVKAMPKTTDHIKATKGI